MGKTKKVNIIVNLDTKSELNNSVDTQAVTTSIADIKQLKQKSLAEKIPAYGLILASLSVFLASLQIVFVKLLTDVNPLIVLVVRNGFQVIIYGVICVIKEHRFWGYKGDEMYQLIRCISGVFFYVLYYVSMKMIPMSDFATINASVPVFVNIFAFIIIKESLSLLKILMAILVLVGVIIVANPEFLFGPNPDQTYENKLLGIIFCTISVICFSMCITLLRKLRRTPVAINGLWLAVFLVIAGSVMVYIMDVFTLPTGWMTWAILISAGFSGILEQTLFIMSFKHESAGGIAVTKPLFIVFSYIWALAIFAEIITWTSIVGSIIISACVVILGIHKYKLEKVQHNQIKIRV